MLRRILPVAGLELGMVRAEGECHLPTSAVSLNVTIPFSFILMLLYLLV